MSRMVTPMRKVLSFLTWIVVALLLYKHIYLQLDLVRAGSVVNFILLFVLAAVSFVLAGSETAIAATPIPQILEWHQRLEDDRQEINRALSAATFNRIGFIRPLAAVLYYFLFTSRTELFIQPSPTGPVVNPERCLTMVVICNNVININMSILLLRCLSDSAGFVSDMPALPLLGSLSSWEGVLPLPGSAGFASVGVTILLLMLGEIVPKKLASRAKIGFLYWSSWVVVLFSWIQVPRIFSHSIEMPVDWLFRKLGRSV